MKATKAILLPTVEILSKQNVLRPGTTAEKLPMTTCAGMTPEELLKVSGYDRHFVYFPSKNQLHEGENWRACQRPVATLLKVTADGIIATSKGNKWYVRPDITIFIDASGEENVTVRWVAVRKVKQ